MIKDVRLGNDLEQPCLVRLQKVGTSSNGKAYARGLLEDNSGTLPFICFEAGPINRLAHHGGTDAIYHCRPCRCQ